MKPVTWLTLFLLFMNCPAVRAGDVPPVVQKIREEVGKVTVNVPPRGAFYLVKEKDRSVSRVAN